MSQRKRRFEQRKAAQSAPTRGRERALVAPPATRAWRSPITWIGVPLVLLLTFAVLSPVLDNQFTNWDDPRYIAENPYIRQLNGDTLRALFSPSVGYFGNYHPVTMLSLAFNYHFAGFEPSAYLATNLGLHLLNTLLVFVFFFLLSGRRAEIALLVALFFGIHPMHVESVAWASARKDVLYSLFFLLSLISYLGYLRPGRGAARRAALYALTTLLFFVASLLSKSAAVVLPVVLLLIDYLWRRPVGPALIVEKIPLFALSVLVGAIAIRTQTAVGAVGDLARYSGLQRLMLPCYGIVMYLVKFVAPVHLSALYPYPKPDPVLPPIYALAPLLVLGIAAFVAWSRRHTRVVVFGAGFFLVCLALVLQLVNVGSAIIADRYTYLPYLGLLFIVAAAYSAVMARHEARWTRWKAAFTGAIALYAAFFAHASWQRAHVWKDSYTLWSDVIERFPDLVEVAYNNRGEFLKDHERYAEALADLDRAIAINPGYVDPYNNRGNVHFALRQDDEAVADYTRALELDPGDAKAYANRGAALVREGMYEAGLRDFERAVQLEPDYSATYLNRAQFYLDTDQFEKAVADLDRYLDLDGDNPDAWYARAVAKRSLRQHRESLADFARAIELRPGDGRMLLSRSRSFQMLGQWEQALADARRAAGRGAAVPPAYLAELERSRALGRDDASVARLRRAIETEPDERSHPSELARLLVARNEFAEAEAVLRAAVARWSCDSGLQVDLANVVARSRGPAGQVEVLAAFVDRCPAPPDMINDLAYLLATARDPQLRDGTRALELAQRAVADYGEHPLVLDTLAVAYAANGRFDRAVEISQRAVREAERLKLPADAMRTLQHHRVSLEAGTPVVDSSSGAEADASP